MVTRGSNQTLRLEPHIWTLDPNVGSNAIAVCMAWIELYSFYTPHYYSQFLNMKLAPWITGSGSQ